MLLGLYFGKFGAKTIEASQPLDLDTFFKILRFNERNMISMDVLKPLTVVVNLIFKKSREGIFATIQKRRVT